MTDPTIDVSESVSDTLPTDTIALRERHYPRYRLAFRVSLLRLLSRLRLLPVRCLRVFTVHIPSLYQY